MLYCIQEDTDLISIFGSQIDGGALYGICVFVLFISAVVAYGFWEEHVFLSDHERERRHRHKEARGKKRR